MSRQKKVLSSIVVVNERWDLLVNSVKKFINIKLKKKKEKRKRNCVDFCPNQWIMICKINITWFANYSFNEIVFWWEGFFG